MAWPRQARGSISNEAARGMTVREMATDIRPQVNPPPCRSPRPEGCAQCSWAYHCHHHRLGRRHIALPGVSLGLLVVLAIVM